MSVPTYNRSESKYAAILKAIDTCTEIYGILENDKIFSSEIKKTIGKAIGDTTSEFLRRISLVQNTEAYDLETYKERVRMQMNLMGTLKSIEPLFDVAKKIVGAKADYFDKLATHINETETIIRKWMILEKKKYERFVQKVA